MAPKTARLGDPHSHGGVIITASPNVSVNGIATARLHDQATCPIHGIVSIVDASDTVLVNGRKRARVGDPLSCGATISDGSPDHFTGE